MKRMATRTDVARLTESLRVELSGTLENRGHAIVGWYLSDPEMAGPEIERVNLARAGRSAKCSVWISAKFSTSV